MSLTRRLSAVLTAAALGWTGLVLAPTAASAEVAGALVVSSGDVGRDAPHDPATYYVGTEGLSGTALATKLNEIIDGNTQLTYAQVYDALPVTDEDPANTANLIVFYSGTSLLKTSRCGGGSCAGQWNREHTWPQSHGDLTTNVGPGTDMFHMRPEFADTNSSRGNKDFDNGGTATVPSCAPCHSTSNTFEPRAAVKGDLARGLMYMDVRFNGDATDGSYNEDLVLGENVPTSGPHIGKLSTLVAWSLADPVDDRERARNDLIDGNYQHNRNPFIDHPEWVCSIWGGSVPPGTCNVAANQPPTTSPMVKTTAEDTATTVALTGSDPDMDALSWSITSPPTHGSANITAGSTLNYTPAANYVGDDVVGVTVSDGKGGTAATTVTITVTAVNDAPAATAQTTSTSLNTAKVITLAGTDVDSGDVLTYAIATPPAHGTVDLAGNQATYTPTGGYSGPDSFTFTVNDGTVSSAPATVSITVNAAGNTAPVATPQSVSTNEDTAKVVTLAGTDADGNTLTYAIGTQPSHGTVNLAGNQATYTPAANYHGPDSFTFTVNDGTVTSPAATVSITVSSVNDAPVATAASETTAEDTAKVITLAGTDADGTTLTYAIGTQPSHGTVNLAGNQATYTPAANYHGPDSFTFTVNDGTVTSPAATVSITVSSVNDAPVATAASETTAEDTAKVITLAGTDADGDTLTYAIGTQPSHGTVNLVGNQATYTPAANYHGPDSFTFTVNDGTVSSPAATASASVTPVNDAPTVTAAALSTTFGSPVTATLVTSDVDGDLVTVLAATAPTHGSVTFSGKAMTYTPTSAGSDAFSVSVSDGNGGIATTSVGVTVAKASATLKISGGSLKAGKPGTIKVKLSPVAGVAVTGKVKLKVAGQTMTVTLKNGVAKFKIAKLPAGTQLKVKAKYLGDAQYMAGSLKKTFPLT